MASIQKRGSSYRITVSDGYTRGGKKNAVQMTYTPAPGMTERQIEKEAARQAVLFEERVKNGGFIPDKNVTFADYADEYMAAAQIEPKTRETYTMLLTRVKAAIGSIRLNKLKARHLEAFYANLRESGVSTRGRNAVFNDLPARLKKACLSQAELARMAGVAVGTIHNACAGKNVAVATAQAVCAALNQPLSAVCTVNTQTPGLSDKSILHYHRLISAILSKAVSDGIVSTNVAITMKNKPKVRRKEAVYLDDKQAAHVVEVLMDEKDIRLVAAVVLLVFAGPRRAELCGLEWGDIVESKGIIGFYRTSQYRKGIGIVDAPTKNISSERSVRVPPFVFSVLRAYRQWWLEYRLSIGDAWIGSDKLFIQRDGRPIHPDTIKYWIDKFIARNGLPRFTPHSLRHTFATLMISDNVSLRTVQAKTGHAQASTLLNLYAHAIQSAEEAATATLDVKLTPRNASRFV